MGMGDSNMIDQPTTDLRPGVSILRCRSQARNLIRQSIVAHRHCARSFSAPLRGSARRRCANAKRSEAADGKAATKRTDDGLPVHSFRSLLGDLATITRNTMAKTGQHDVSFTLVTNPSSSSRLPTSRRRR